MLLRKTLFILLCFSLLFALSTCRRGRYRKRRSSRSWTQRTRSYHQPSREYQHPTRKYHHSTRARGYHHPARARDYHHSNRQYHHQTRQYHHTTRPYHHPTRQYDHPSRQYHHPTRHDRPQIRAHHYPSREHHYPSREHHYAARAHHNPHMWWNKDIHKPAVRKHYRRRRPKSRRYKHKHHRSHPKYWYNSVSSSSSAVHEPPQQPNLIFIMADDLGWNDVGFHNDFIRTPNIDALAASGLELTQYHTELFCTPSRAALLTGRYASQTGLNVGVVQPLSKTCLPLEFTTFPERLKAANYVNKLVGKWHLGDCSESCLPTNRGFDEYAGFTGGQAEYFNWTLIDVVMKFKDTQIDLNNIGQHLTRRHTEQAREMIMAHKNNEKPLFMYVSPMAPHSPYQVTEEMLNRHPELDLNTPAELERRKYLGLVSALDDLVGEVVQALKDAELFENSIIFFTSDNGGSPAPAPTPIVTDFAGNNFPLRGTKGEMFQGSVQVPAVVNGALLPHKLRGTKRNGLMHITDWFPTLLSLAGAPLSKKEETRLNGVDQTELLFGAKGWSAREDMLVAMTSLNFPSQCADELTGFRHKDWKLIQGPRLGLGPIPDNVRDRWWNPIESPNLPNITGDSCNKTDKAGNTFFACLFDLKDDPFEQRDLFDEFPDVVEFLQNAIDKLKKEAVQNVFSLANRTDPARSTVIPGGFRVLTPGYCNPLVDSPLEPVDFDLCPI